MLTLVEAELRAWATGDAHLAHNLARLRQQHDESRPLTWDMRTVDPPDPKPAAYTSGYDKGFDDGLAVGIERGLLLAKER